ncbi:MAG: phosphatase PAP2 family protein [Thermodesulfobacteriota bacterium]
MTGPSWFTSRRSAAILLGSLALALIGLFDAQAARALRFGPGQGAAVTALGFWLGHGLVDLTLLAGLYMLARRLGRPNLRTAAGQAFWAFVLSGVLVQAVKHLVGRPRPRLVGEYLNLIGPTLAAGTDSFPSGHTATSVAVALVLSWHYPRGAPLFMGLAAFVAMSRLTGGAHYPLDVLGGLALGFLAGWGVLRFAQTRRANGKADG